jgi:DNA-binding PadR family transcriptional regulator
MSLAHALLTSLLETPSSGYDLTRRFDDTIGPYWNAKHQQIYRELALMEANGWVASSPASTRGKKEYRVLPAGRDELGRWMAEPSAPAPIRSSFAVKLRASMVLDAVDLRPEVEQNLAHHEAQLARFEDFEQRHFPGDKSLSRRAAINHCILRQGILLEQARIAWCREVLDLLSAPNGDRDAARKMGRTPRRGTPPH